LKKNSILSHWVRIHFESFVNWIHKLNIWQKSSFLWFLVWKFKCSIVSHILFFVLILDRPHLDIYSSSLLHINSQIAFKYPLPISILLYLISWYLSECNTLSTIKAFRPVSHSFNLHPIHPQIFIRAEICLIFRRHLPNIHHHLIVQNHHFQVLIPPLLFILLLLL
jgi:hypothetical protein